MRAPQDIFEVSELTREIKGLFESHFAQVWVRGEISGLRMQSSGHVYFSLKDENAQLSAVVFRGAAAKLKMQLRDGMRVLAFGRIDVYEPRGSYQLIAQAVLEDGIGPLQQAFERLKEKLSQEGLFDEDRKKEIPRFPRTVGFVTSPTGAVLRDFWSLLKNGQWKGTLVLLPAQVQGAGAADTIAKQIVHADKSGLFDLLVVGRGGGSLEDLWAFNEEQTVRAIAACDTPVISAVGHQTDFTLADFAADHRAETPSAAASLIVANYRLLLDELEETANELFRKQDDIFEDLSNELEFLSHRLDKLHPGNFIENSLLRLDELSGRLLGTWREKNAHARTALHEAALRFAQQDPTQKFATYRATLDGLEKRLQAVGIEGSLKRGFVLLANEHGGVISRKKQLPKGKRIHARFHDGNAQLDVPN